MFFFTVKIRRHSYSLVTTFVYIRVRFKFQSFIFTSLEAYTLDFDDMPTNLRANLSTFSIMPQEEKITWTDYGVDAADGEKVMLSFISRFLKQSLKIFNCLSSGDSLFVLQTALSSSFYR